MRRSFIMGTLLSSVAFVGGANAAEMAVVISNGNYETLRDDRAATRAHSGAVQIFSGSGYDVLEDTDLDRLAIQQMLARLDSVVDELQGIVVLCAGQFVNDGQQTWFLPTDFEGDSALDVAFNAVPLQLFLDFAARHPGRAVIALAPSTSTVDWQDGLSGGVAVGNVPQGVLLMAGPRSAITDELQSMMARGATVASALEDVDSDITVQGFVSPDWGLGAEAAASSAPENLMDMLAEQALWVATESAGKADDYRAFLRQFPNGTFAELARSRLRGLEDSTPAPKPAPERTEPTPQQIETALRLTRKQRSEIQADLTLLGHDTRGVDGIFGRGSRTAIAEWQKSAGFEATGYLTADQVTILDRQAERRRDTINAEDRRFWQLTGQSGQVDDLRLYLDRYPNGLYAAQAREQLAAINAESRAEEDRAAWESASAANTAEAYREYLRRFEDGLFADVARARLAAIEREETDDSAAIAAEERMNLNRGSRLAIETALATRGFRVGQIDGEFDAATRRAIADFQASKGLAATGYIDPATFRALLLG